MSIFLIKQSFLKLVERELATSSPVGELRTARTQATVEVRECTAEEPTGERERSSENKDSTLHGQEISRQESSQSQKHMKFRSCGEEVPVQDNNRMQMESGEHQTSSR